MLANEIMEIVEEYDEGIREGGIGDIRRDIYTVIAKHEEYRRARVVKGILLQEGK